MRRIVILAALIAFGLALLLVRPGDKNRVRSELTVPVESSKEVARVSSLAVRPPAALIQVPESLRAIISTNAPYPKRLKAMEALGKHLSSEEVAALTAYLQQRGVAVGLTAQADSALKNEVLNTLLSQEPPIAGLPEFLAGLYQDRYQNAVMRDYAIQHLHSWYQNAMTPAEGACRPDAGDLARQKQATQQLFWDALKETDSSIAGTALLALSDLAVQEPLIDASAVKSAALKLAQDSGTGTLSRITALQVCARMGVAEALPMAFKLAQNSGDVALQIPAIAALGQLGGPAELAWLQSVDRQANPRLIPALETAQKTINKRLASAISR
jgi:hypothetical protein